MQNAHTRFGTLRYVFRKEKRSTSIAVPLERMIAEVEAEPPRRARAHFLSLVGSDAQMAALCAALSNKEIVTVEAPGLEPLPINFTEKPEYYRGSVMIRDHPRPFRHLIAVSQELAGAGISDRPYRTFFVDSTPEFIWTSVAQIHGLPGLPQWASWFHRQLTVRKAATPLLGIGCDPVLVVGSRKMFLSWLGEGISSGELEFPPENGPISWPSLSLKQNLFRFESLSEEIRNAQAECVQSA